MSVLRFFIVLLLSLMGLFSESRANASDSASNVLGRTKPLHILCDDFEDKNWHYDYVNHKDHRGFWHDDSVKGEPELLSRVSTPKDGKIGSIGALEIRTNVIDNDKMPDQEDLSSGSFSKIYGFSLRPQDQPVFIIRIWLPPFYQWGDYYVFGFRQTAHASNGNEYYPSIFLRYSIYDNPYLDIRSGAYFYCRIGSGVANDVRVKPITEPGWWTLAIAFDQNGIGSYYACPGANNILSENDKIFDTTQFITTNGTKNPSMDDVAYSFFSLMYPKEGNASPKFIVDDYEVWIAEQP